MMRFRFEDPTYEWCRFHEELGPVRLEGTMIVRICKGIMYDEDNQECHYQWFAYDESGDWHSYCDLCHAATPAEAVLAMFHDDEVVRVWEENGETKVELR